MLHKLKRIFAKNVNQSDLDLNIKISPLMCAIKLLEEENNIEKQNNIFQIINLLIQYGADLNHKSGLLTPLYIAVKLENKTLIKTLVENGVAIDEQALKLAKESSDKELYKLLIKSDKTCTTITNTLPLATQQDAEQITVIDHAKIIEEQNLKIAQLETEMQMLKSKPIDNSQVKHLAIGIEIAEKKDDILQEVVIAKTHNKVAVDKIVEIKSETIIVKRESFADF
jgi:hypothetical protein